MRLLVFVTASGVMLLLSLILGFITTPILIPTFFVGLEGSLLVASLRKIPTKNIAIVKFLGKRQRALTGKTNYVLEGWNAFVPFFFDYSNVSIENVEFQPKMENVRTSEDMAEIEVHLGITFAAHPDYAIEYENSGGEGKVKQTLSDIADEAVRTLAITPNKEPNTWEQAVSMKAEFLNAILTTICERHAPENPEEDLGIKSLAEQLESANGYLLLPSLGIGIKKLNIKKIHPTGKLVEAAEKLAIERRETKAEHQEMENVRDLIVGTIKTVKDETEQKVSFEQASEIVQTERGKITKTVAKKTLAIDPETREFARAFVSPIADAVGAGFNKVIEAIASKTKSEEVK